MSGGSDFVWSGLSSSGGLSPNYNSGTCTNTYCHGNQMPVVNRGTNTAPVWTNSSYITGSALTPTAANCNICHKSPPPFQTDGITSHQSMTLAANVCDSCHSHTGSGKKHIDGSVSAVTACNGCHWYDTNDTNAWTSSEPNPATGLTNSMTAWGAHITHIDHLKTRLSISPLSALTDTFGGTKFNAICAVCHTKVLGNHKNVTREVTFGEATLHQFGSSATQTYNAGIRSCSNIDCHFKQTPQW
jgi:predicted CxxxxCH...CXXCH cytochrome family protein